MKKIALSLLVASAFTACKDNNNDNNNLNEFQPQVVVSSNTTAAIRVLDVRSLSNVSIRDLSIEAEDSDGIFYNSSGNSVLQVGRSNNRLSVYNGFSSDVDSLAANADAQSDTSIYSNGRGAAFNGNTVAVADDINPGKIDFFLLTGNQLNYQASSLTDFQVWGIEFDGTDLYAVQDETSNLFLYESVDPTSGAALNNGRNIIVTGLIRTHGIHFDAENNTMVLTDIGLAESDSDGAIIVVNNWSNAMQDGIISLDEQIVIRGNQTLLGNPVDVSYSSENDLVFVAERAKDGGKILVFKVPGASGNVAPVYTNDFPGASSIDFRF